MLTNSGNNAVDLLSHSPQPTIIKVHKKELHSPSTPIANSNIYPNEIEEITPFYPESLPIKTEKVDLTTLLS
eukprot:307622-Ditylum_brightwellii.AAC.1